MDYPINKYIYVRPPSTVLINPHFAPQLGKSVYINPKFGDVARPKIHINPNVLNNIVAPLRTQQVEPPKPAPRPALILRNKIIRNVPEKPSNPLIKTMTNCDKPRPVLSRTKIVRTPSSPKFITRTKLIRNASTPKFISRTKWVKRNSISSPISKFRAKLSPNKSFKLVNQFKFDKRAPKKKYVFVERFSNVSIVAKNVIIKRNPKFKKPGYININGILYKKSANSLCRADKKGVKTKYKIVNKTTDKRKTRSKLGIKVVKNKLKITNIPCPVYRKTGKCERLQKGTCSKKHDPDQIVLCRKFLQGACLDNNCPLSHKVSFEKMPTCKYYLEGVCSKDNCPYLHVKISAKAKICKDFLNGFCKKGVECEFRHQYLCPDFEIDGNCKKRKCPYPHASATKKRAEECETKIVEEVGASKEIIPSRYFKDSAEDGKGEDNIEMTTNRPKLGALPDYIPLL